MSERIKHIEALTEIKGGNLLAIASTEAEDRVGDSLKASDWGLDPYKDNPVLQAGHDHKPQYTIGVAKNIHVDKDNRLVFEPVFHEFTELARSIKKMYFGGILKAWSVGYMPKEEEEAEDDEKSGKRKSKSFNQLLEVSAVAVPANAEALTMVEKGIEKADKLEDKVIKEIDDWIKKGCGDEEEECKPCKESEEKVEEKSPACRKAGETKAECVSRKIPEIMKEDTDMKQDQAVAIANSVCSKKCEEKQIHKRWNTQLSKAFDVEKVESKPANFEYEIYTKFLGCKIKDVFVNNYLIPSPLLGTYLAGFKEMLGRFELIDTRNFAWGGGELPPVYEVIKLNSEKSDDFLIDGINFYKSEGKNALIVKFIPEWYGLVVTMINRSSKREVNKGLLKDIHKWVKDNNFLKNEKFAISGEFLPESKKTWDDVILSKDTKDPIVNSIKTLNSKKEEARSRGLLFMGEPGTGKTQSGKVIMKEAESTFIWVSSKDMAAYSGALSLGFELARDLAPTVLFIEDIDSWLRDYNVDTLKIEMDGIRENKGLVTILTTNFPENLPKALLDRPGRFHDVLNFELPSGDVRKKMITRWVDKIETKTLDDMVEKTKGFSGAYIKELIDYAEMIAEDEDIDMDKALLVSLEKIKKQKELIEEIEKRNKKEEEKKENDKKMRDIIEKAIEANNKEGRVLSGKNKRIITDAVMASKDAVTALEKLLEATDTAKVDEKLNNKSVITLEKKPLKLKGDGEFKGRIIKRKANKLPIDFIVERVVRRVLESD